MIKLGTQKMLEPAEFILQKEKTDGHWIPAYNTEEHNK